MIGICSRYRKGDATHAAIAMAKHLDSKGRTSSFLYYDGKTEVDPGFDNKARRKYFQEWLSEINHALWTTPVEDIFLNASLQKSIKSTLYTSWEQLIIHDKFVMGMYAHVLVPTIIQATHIRDAFNIINVAVLPFNCGYPITMCKAFREPDKIKVCLSLYGDQARKIDNIVLLILADIMLSNNKIHTTIACSGNPPLKFAKFLKLFEKKLEGRWTVLRDANWHSNAKMMGDSDVTIWPVKWDGFGNTALTSLHMGTPVVAWDIPAMNEHLLAGRNAILIESDFDYNEIGVPKALPDYVEFERILKWLLSTPSAIMELKTHTHERLALWDNEFHKGLETILPIE